MSRAPVRFLLGRVATTADDATDFGAAPTRPVGRSGDDALGVGASRAARNAWTLAASIDTAAPLLPPSCADVLLFDVLLPPGCTVGFEDVLPIAKKSSEEPDEFELRSHSSTQRAICSRNGSGVVYGVSSTRAGRAASTM